MDLLDQVKALRAKYLPVNRDNVQQKPWYRIENAASTEKAVVYIYDEIHWLWGVSADDFVSELNAITAPTIELHLNSPGGDVFDGLAIYTSLRQHTARVEVVVDALAASIASVIALAGDSRVITPNGMMMIHDAAGATFGPADLHREMADLLDKISTNIAAVYAERATTDTDTAGWRETMLATKWYTADEAVEAGLMDSVATPNGTSETDDESDAVDAFLASVFVYGTPAPAANNTASTTETEDTTIEPPSVGDENPPPDWAQIGATIREAIPR